MGVETNITILKEENIDYPKLMRHNSSSKMLIVLFTKEKEGIVIASNCNGWNIGDISSDFSMESFINFNGEIKLSNK